MSVSDDLNFNNTANGWYKNAVEHGFYEDDITLRNILLKLGNPTDEDAAAARDLLGVTLTQTEGLSTFYGVTWKLSRMALIMSELGEACEAIRKPSLKSEHLPNVRLVEEELADVIIRVGDFAASEAIDMDRAVELKAAYNKSRPFKHGKLA